jgi:tellurite resistance-related uncharacterized protein
MSDGLDFYTDNVDERIEVVQKILDKNDEFLVEYYSNHYNPHINQTGFLSESTKVGKDLEALANYILYAKDSEAPEDTVTDYRKKRNTSREASIENVIKVSTVTKKETNKSIMKAPKIKVTRHDRNEHIELKNTGDAILSITKMIREKVDSKGNPLNDKEVRKLKWIRTDMQKDEIAVKTELKKYVRFNSVIKSEPDMNALSYIRFDDEEIIRILIEDYAELKEQSYEDTFGYMKIIIFAFEELVELANLEGYVKDIFLWKIENVQYDEMISMLKDKYDMKITKPRLSKFTRETIPNMIVEAYKQQKEDWVYTHIMKGNYKSCSVCKKNHLATTKYFNPDKQAKSGLRSVCKECRRRKYKSNVSAKSE